MKPWNLLEGAIKPSTQPRLLHSRKTSFSTLVDLLNNGGGLQWFRDISGFKRDYPQPKDIAGFEREWWGCPILTWYLWETLQCHKVSVCSSRPTPLEDAASCGSNGSLRAKTLTSLMISVLRFGHHEKRDCSFLGYIYIYVYRAPSILEKYRTTMYD